MTDKYKEMIQDQLKKLDQDDFDFDAWKSSTIIVLAKIFGKGDQKIAELENLRIEYGSSWSMRAVSGSFDPETSARKHGREIVEVALKELELYGEAILSPCAKVVDEAVAEVMRMADYRKLEDILAGGDPITVKEDVNKFLKNLTKDELTMVLTHILINR